MNRTQRLAGDLAAETRLSRAQEIQNFTESQKTALSMSEDAIEGTAARMLPLLTGTIADAPAQPSSELEFEDHLAIGDALKYYQLPGFRAILDKTVELIVSRKMTAQWKYDHHQNNLARERLFDEMDKSRRLLPASLIKSGLQKHIDKGMNAGSMADEVETEYQRLRQMAADERPSAPASSSDRTEFNRHLEEFGKGEVLP